MSFKRFWPEESWSISPDSRDNQSLDLAAVIGEYGAMSSKEHASAEAADQTGNLPRVLSVLDRLTEEELHQLNHVVVQRLRLIQQIRAHGQMINLRIGQAVRFTSSDGQVVRGVITRHNRKSVTLVTHEGVQWRVSPSLLQVDEPSAGNRRG